MTHPVGATLHSRYRIVRLLGQGGFGTMYRAWDTILGRPCALKENRDPAPDVQRQFLREAKILANLSHPNLPRVTDYFIEGPGQYLVMDFIAGKDLQEMLDDRGGPLPEDQILAWIREICDALTYLHRRKPPVIHRDIKPGNIKITPEGKAVLVDFGIAKIHDPGTKTTMGAQAVTPGFSPYEQYGKGATDARSDIYALGATLYTLLTGVEPPESVQRVTRDPLVLARQLNPHLSLRTASAVMRALQMDPTQRFQSAEDFKSALNPPPRPAAPLRQPPPPGAAAPPASTAVPNPRNPFWIVAPTALLLMLLLAYAFASRLPTGSPALVEANEPGASIPVTAAPIIESTTAMPSISAAPPTIAAATPRFETPLAYVVQIGDTCSEIAARFNVSTAEIARLNRLPADCGVIFGGQTLLIPRRAEPAASLPARSTSTAVEPAATRISDMDEMIQVYVPSGEFLMGAAQDDDQASAAERPQRRVHLKAFWIDRTEVTNKMYARCVAERACSPPSRKESKTRESYFDNPAYQEYPVIFVSWQMAVDYCRWAGRRLPTEAEWEKAARGVEGKVYPWGDELPTPARANFDNQIGDTSRVGGFPAGVSPYGALDMAGNVAEWVADWYAEDAYILQPDQQPAGPDEGLFRVIRGGSWYNPARAMRTVFRLWNYPNLLSDSVGIRCASG